MTHMDKRSLEQVRGSLRTLLEEYEDDPPAIGVDLLNDDEKSFLIATCCVELVKHIILQTAKGDRKEARRGLEAIFADVRKQFAQ